MEKGKLPEEPKEPIPTVCVPKKLYKIPEQTQLELKELFDKNLYEEVKNKLEEIIKTEYKEKFKEIDLTREVEIKPIKTNGEIMDLTSLFIKFSSDEFTVGNRLFSCMIKKSGNEWIIECTNNKTKDDICNLVNIVINNKDNNEVINT